jgi:hypothetical protein
MKMTGTRSRTPLLKTAIMVSPIMAAKRLGSWAGIAVMADCTPNQIVLTIAMEPVKARPIPITAVIAAM